MKRVLSVTATLAMLGFPFMVSGLPQMETNSLVQAAGLLGYRAPFDKSFFLKNDLLAKATADECFREIGSPYLPAVNGNCSEGIPKTNEAYAWGLAQSGNKLIVGTAPNVLCIAQGLVFNAPGFPLNITEPVLTKSWACEFGQSGFRSSIAPQLPEALGDWRPPNVYAYDIQGKTTTRLTPTDPKIFNTLGLRSAGSLGDIAILGGPNFQLGVNFFAYNLKTGAYLGSCSASHFNNIRQFTTLDNVLYAGVGTPVAGNVGGAIVRWVGSVDKPLEGGEFCGFDVVAELPGDAAFLVNYGYNRLATSTWPGTAGIGDGVTGVFLSPEIQSGGLTVADRGTVWKLLWRASDYEPDAVTAKSIAGGAIAYWGGSLYFGTLQVPGTAAFAHIGCSTPNCYGPTTNTQDLLKVFLNTTRATSFWRISNADSATPKVNMLYGETQLPALIPGTKKFAYQSTGVRPVYGKSGFGNPWNSYSWTAAAFKNKLYVGTFDSRYVAESLATSLLTDQFGMVMKSLFSMGAQAMTPSLVGYTKGFGTDLWRFDSAVASAKPLDTRGVGNYLNYGIRTMLPAADGRELFIGTANAMNLEPNGGWEIRSLK